MGQKVDWEIIHLYFMVTQKMQPQGDLDIDKCYHLFFSSFSDGSNGLLLGDKLIEHLHVDRKCNVAEYCFCQYPSRRVFVYF